MPALSTASASRPPLSVRLADYAVMTLAIVLGGGSIVLFAWPGRPVLVPLGLSLGAALSWNAALSIVFFLQHSVLVRRSVRARLATVIPWRYDGACYAITSGIALALVAVMRQPGGAPLFVLTGLPRLAVTAAGLLAICGFVWGIYTLRTFDPFGLRPIREHLRGPSAHSLTPALRRQRPRGARPIPPGSPSPVPRASSSCCGPTRRWTPVNSCSRSCGRPGSTPAPCWKNATW